MAAEARDRGREDLEASLDGIPLEDRERISRAAADFFGDFSAALAAYSATFAGGEPDGQAPEGWLEQLALRWRVLMEQCGVERTGEDVLSDEGAQLYSALEDSFALLRSDREDRRKLLLGAKELLSRMLSAGEGIWHDGWEESRERMLTAIDRGAGGPVHLLDAEVHRPSRLRLRFQRRLREEMPELLDLAKDAYSAIAFFYKDLAPDGRELTDEEQLAVRGQIEDAAAADRVLDLRRAVFPESDWEAVRLLLGELRSLRRSLVLALSPDPERRALVVTIAEAGLRTFVMGQRVEGATHEEAIARLPTADQGGESGER